MTEIPRTEEAASALEKVGNVCVCVECGKRMMNWSSYCDVGHIYCDDNKISGRLQNFWSPHGGESQLTEGRL